MEDATHTSACVRKPAGRPWKVRSKPIRPPTRTAAAIRAHDAAYILELAATEARKESEDTTSKQD